MKKTLHILLAVLLLAGLTATAQIQRGKKPSASKTEQTTKKQKQGNLSNSAKSSKSITSRSSRPSGRGMTQAQKDRIIQQAIDDMVWVDGGTFMMGATAEQGDARNDEKPVHQVTLSGYYISKYEVTQELWLAVMGSNPSYNKSNLKNPVEEVTWDDCQMFIIKLNKLTGKQFRLPTEAEWEYAARGGNRSGGYKYAGSNNLDAVAWYGGNSADTTHPVGQKSPNELGLYDMSGNVWEWCQDWYGNYNSGSQTNPSGASSGSDRVFRGGNYFLDPWSCHVSCRNASPPGSSFDDQGLRLAL